MSNVVVAFTSDLYLRLCHQIEIQTLETSDNGVNCDAMSIMTMCLFCFHSATTVRSVLEFQLANKTSLLGGTPATIR